MIPLVHRPLSATCSSLGGKNSLVRSGKERGEGGGGEYKRKEGERKEYDGEGKTKKSICSFSDGKEKVLWGQVGSWDDRWVCVMG